MQNRISELASSLKHLGEIQVTDWDFMALLNKDIRDIEITHSLRRWGSIRVMEWDFRTVLPAVNKLAHQEVDVVGLVKRTAGYKVMEWDFRNALHADAKSNSPGPSAPRVHRPGAAEMQTLILGMKDFLQYVVVNLITEPKHALIKVREIAPGVLRFKIVLTRKDVTMLIGMEGHTAAAIRNVLKAAASAKGVHALLRIVSHEEDMAGVGEDAESDRSLSPDS